jgi:hypothetical protein
MHFLKTPFTVLLLLISFISFAQAFPETEKEVTSILCRGKWEVVEMGDDTKMRKMKVMGIEMIMQFKADGSYTGNIAGAAKEGGTWKLDMATKEVKMFEGDPNEPRSFIRELGPNRMLIVTAGERVTKMILQPVK